MMTTQKSHRKILFKKLTILPILAGFVLLFANRVAAQETITVTENQKPLNEFKDKTEEQLYKDFVNRNSYITFEDENGQKVIKHYNEMTDEQKKSLTPLYSSKKIIKRVPSITQLNNWKDNTKYAIWIDDKVIDNTLLNNYKHTDFANFFDSFVHKNARSKRFPQTHQVHLSTNAYFKKKSDENVNGFEEYKKLQKFKKKHAIYPLKKALENSIKNISTKQRGASKKQIATYNILAKKYNKIAKKNRIIKFGDVQKMESIYKIMTKEQKRSSEPFPKKIPPPPAPKKIDFTNIPPPPSPILKKEATKQDFIKHKKALKEWEKKIKNYPPPPPPQKKKSVKITPKFVAKNKVTNDTKIFTFKTLSGQKTVHQLDSLKNKLPNNVKYYLNGELISKAKINNLKVNSIKAVKVVNRKKEEQALYITTHK